VTSLGITSLTACGNTAFNQFVKQLKAHPEYQGVKLDFNGYDGAPNYSVYVHNNNLAGKLRPKYIDATQIAELISIPNIQITTEVKNNHTFIPAADIDPSKGTNYDAI
jgi:hypothetical protein